MLAESASFLALNEADFTIWPLKRNFLELNNMAIIYFAEWYTEGAVTGQ